MCVFPRFKKKKVYVYYFSACSTQGVACIRPNLPPRKPSKNRIKFGGEKKPLNLVIKSWPRQAGHGGWQRPADGVQRGLSHGVHAFVRSPPLKSGRDLRLTSDQRVTQVLGRHLCASVTSGRNCHLASKSRCFSACAPWWSRPPCPCRPCGKD